MQLANEQVFQQDIIGHLVFPKRSADNSGRNNEVVHGWKLGTSDAYDRKHALYTEDLVGYLSETQPDQWDKFSRMHGTASPECRTDEHGISNIEGSKAVQALLRSVSRQLDKKGTFREWNPCGDP